MAFLGPLCLLLCINSLTACAPANNNLSELYDKGALDVAVLEDVERFSYTDKESGETMGFEPALAALLTKSILGEDAVARFTPVSSQTRGLILDTGEVDCVIACLVPTDDLKSKYAFSNPYYTDEVCILVQNGQISEFSELKGKKIGVVSNSAAISSLDSYAQNNSVSFIFVEFASYPDALDALNNGNIDAFCSSGAILFSALTENTYILPERLGELEYCVASSKKYESLITAINDKLDELENEIELIKAEYNIS